MKLGIAPKILAALFFSNVIVILSMATYLSWNFKTGFKDYLQQIESEQVSPILSPLSVLYQQQENWDSLKENHRLWHEILAQALPEKVRPSRARHPKSHPKPDQQAGQQRHPPPHLRKETPPPHPRNYDIDPLSLLPRLHLLDANKQRIIGQRGDANEQDSYLPITSPNGIVGWLVLAPSAVPMDDIEKRFYDQQFMALWVIAIMAFVFSLLVAVILTKNLTRPIQALAKGASALTLGRLNTRIPITSADELGQLAGDFNNLAHTLENNEQSRRQWVADISHELRTPLAVLQGEIEAMQDGIRPLDKVQVDSLHAEVLSLGKLIEDLYQLSLSDIGALSYSKQALDPAAILCATIANFKPRFSSKNIQIKNRYLATGQVLILADPARLSQLFSNLLENSFKYTQAGGELFAAVKHCDSYITLSIADSFPGVPDSALRHLFERLYRVDTSRTRTTGGAGLGLSICSSIVEAHDGEISASHAKQGGLKVLIRLPLHKTGARNDSNPRHE